MIVFKSKKTLFSYLELFGFPLGMLKNFNTLAGRTNRPIKSTYFIYECDNDRILHKNVLKGLFDQVLFSIGFFPPLDNPAPDSRFRRWALQFRRRIRQKVLRLYLASSITSRFIVRQILYLTSFSDVWCVQLSINIKCVRLHAWIHLIE